MRQFSVENSVYIQTLMELGTRWYLYTDGCWSECGLFTNSYAIGGNSYKVTIPVFMGTRVRRQPAHVKAQPHAFVLTVFGFTSHSLLDHIAYTSLSILDISDTSYFYVTKTFTFLFFHLIRISNR